MHDAGLRAMDRLRTWSAPLSKVARSLAQTQSYGVASAVQTGALFDPANYPPLAEWTVYVIGDIHGRSDLLLDLHRKIDRDSLGLPRGRIVEIYLGDYIDRGPDSRGVLDCLVERGAVRRAVFLRGNHEVMLADFLAGRLSLEVWAAVGGVETIESFDLDGRLPSVLESDEPDVELGARIPLTHKAFLASLCSSFDIGPYAFVHAGIRPGIPFRLQDARDICWIRNDFLNYAPAHEFIVVHGHSPVLNVDFRPNRINVDTGAYLTDQLSCLKIDGFGVQVL
jgi:serine/threonine protein phosphatase 1